MAELTPPRSPLDTDVPLLPSRMAGRRADLSRFVAQQRLQFRDLESAHASAATVIRAAALEARFASAQPQAAQPAGTTQDGGG
eukprot:CAMPEP_0174941764 /NCGR_PEP_ID=MMETSP1355-20121228/72614_1 /TAXON_ID=464990 /ORGANISM="Hemiselmis tepida, Strain CCMP443" /LENGTH=82 /DNA_ID=CAMNT_0016188889 /DNA_START=110 /DNA_END=355 /DNA_ORIENTATION=-